MKVIETNLKFTGTLGKRASTNRIVLHHAAAAACTVENVHSWHITNGWGGIGYHYFVRKDGSIYRGRPEDTVGVHAGNHNDDTLGICFEGNFENESMPAAQSAAGAELVGDIKKRYGTLNVIRHKDVNATACPGKNFPFDTIKAGTAAPVVKPPATSAIKVGSKVRVNSGAKDYNGKGLASFVYSTVYDVLEIKGDRVVIGLGKAVTAAVKSTNLKTEAGATVSVASKPAAPPTIKVGSKVGVKSGSKDYNGKGLASFVYSTTYDVLEVKGDRIVIGLGKAVTAAVKISNLTLR